MRAGQDVGVPLSGVVRGYSTPLDAVTWLALVACMVWAWWRNPEFRWNPRWLGISAGLFLLYWPFPAARAGGADADTRLLLFLFIVALAPVNVGARARTLAAIAVLLFAMRAANVTYHFVAAQPRLEDQARALAAVPMHARVLPLMQSQDERSVYRDYFQFWAYGVIERGWYAPYLFHLKGIQPFRMVIDTYRPVGFWGMQYNQEPDWARVRQDYDYVWAYNVPRFHPALSAIGEEVFTAGQLRVYSLNQPAGATTQGGR